jgi:hypothetical protein
MKHFAYFVLIVTLAACGGGGGGAPPAAPAEPALAEITSQNAPAITAGAMDAVLGSALLAGFGGTDLFLPTSVTSTGGIVGAGEVVLKLIRRHGAATQLRRILVVVGPFTEPCLVSGSITFSADLQNETTLSPGDSITADFSNCDDGDGLILNGGFDFTFVSFSQSIVDCFVFNACTGEDQLTVDIDFRDLQTTAGAVTLSVVGDQTLEIDTTTPPTSTTTISGDSLTISDAAFTQSLSAYSTTVTVNSLTAAYTIDGNGTSEVPTLFSDPVIYATTDPLTGIAIGVVAPDSGSVLIEGADSATITLVVLNNVQVQLEIDLDGDGITDETQSTTWDELGTLL